MDLFTHVLSAVPEGRMIGIDMQMALQTGIQLFNAVVLFVLLRYILYKPVSAFLQKRADRVKSQMDQAALDMEAADLLKLEYKENLSNIEQERTEILDVAHKSAEKKSKDMVLGAKHEADAARKEAELDILHQQELAYDSLKHHVIELSSAMASKIMAHVVDEAAQDRLFEEALHELEGATWSK